MNRTTLVIGLSLTASALAVFAERDAAACGGCFHPPTQTASDITDERMLLSVSTTQSTLYDQIQYAGNPTSFAWVLPIHGTVDVGLSADVLFDSIDALTATTIVPPEPNCPPPPNCGGGTSSGGAFGVAGGDTAAPAVTVTKAENVGPYATVQLHSTDSSALDAWLAQNGFAIPSDVVPIINEYVTEGFDFLAMKLLPNQGVQAMRPVRVTSPGASLSLPLRMAAVGTGATVGITIWVVSDGRYEPQNFPFFHIDDSALVWDFSTSLSNYTTLRAQHEQALGGAGWEIESSLTLNQQLITSVILSGGQYYGGGGNFGGVQSAPSDAAQDYLSIGSADAGADAGSYQSAEDVRTADIAALFAGVTGSNARVTRMRSDISHAVMTKDFVLQASADQSELSNVRTVTQSVNLVCPVYSSCSAVGNDGTSSGTSSGTANGTANGDGTYSRAPNANGSAASDGGGGCVASAQSTGGSAASFGALAGLLGLALARVVRSRRRS
ncbi:MAG TPA: DUF2330 domain-containing protein [Polyangiaceae bacterium]